MQSVSVGLNRPTSGGRHALFSKAGACTRLMLTGLAAASLAACQPEAETVAPQVRPVRTVTVVKRDVGETVSYTGRIQAENETRLAFRISGRMVERPINVGDHVDPGQVVAKLEPQDELNALRTAQASVAAAQGQLNQVQSNFDRQKTLLARDIASRAQFEQSESALKTARAQLDTAEAQLKAAKDRVSYTELRVDAGGTVIATGAEPGEVV
jgi:membrane fusion protein, multidrug efflux system